MLKGKKILLGITGSIAAYKSLFLIRLLVKEGANVKVVLTSSAKGFVTPLSVSTLSQNPAYSDFFEKETGEWNNHVELGLWADFFVIAPVTASTISKMAHGQADNLLITTYLSARCPVFFAPAMDLDMYKHPTTQKNIKILQQFGNILINPGSGELASGLNGEGRMAEPEEIVETLKKYKPQGILSGKNVLVSAGPTYEKIDPVRFVGNFSSGLMGIELAKEAYFLGADVTLVCGPTHLEMPQHIKVVRVESAKEMELTCLEYFNLSDITIMAAAVADYTVSEKSNTKIKKNSGSLSLELVPTTDILSAMGKRKNETQLLVGFALETDNELQNAQKKLVDKKVDVIVLNSLKTEGAGFSTPTNKVSMLLKNGKVLHTELKSKREIAKEIWQTVVNLEKE
jgi:phosphopantothenoylcysteine decarboxylase/phosphopantothenate--cysteine ligase